MPNKHKSIVASIQEQIITLENENNHLREQAKEYKRKYLNVKRQLERAETASVNNSELESLRIENDRLKVQLNQVRRSSHAEEKLKQIQKILNRQ